MDEQTIVPTTDVPVTSPTPPIEDKSSFDPQSFGEGIMAQVEAKFPDLVEKVSQKTREDIINKIIGQENKETKKSPYIPTSYEELMEKTVEKAVKSFEDRQKDAVAKSEQEAKEKAEQEAKVLEDNNKYWEKQLSELETDNVLPPLPKEISEKLSKNEKLSEEEQTHPSIKARAELYAKSKELKDKGDSDWWNFKYVAYKFGIGRDIPEAPVMYRNSYSQPTEKSAYTYEDIHNMSFQDIAKGR